jgi:hypothetical protein
MRGLPRLSGKGCRPWEVSYFSFSGWFFWYLVVPILKVIIWLYLLIYLSHIYIRVLLSVLMSVQFGYRFGSVLVLWYLLPPGHSDAPVSLPFWRHSDAPLSVPLSVPISASVGHLLSGSVSVIWSVVCRCLCSVIWFFLSWTTRTSRTRLGSDGN